MNAYLAHPILPHTVYAIVFVPAYAHVLLLSRSVCLTLSLPPSLQQTLTRKETFSRFDSGMNGFLTFDEAYEVYMGMHVCVLINIHMYPHLRTPTHFCTLSPSTHIHTHTPSHEILVSSRTLSKRFPALTNNAVPLISISTYTYTYVWMYVCIYTCRLFVPSGMS